MKTKLLFKSLLVAAALCVGASSAWSVAPTLTSSLEVAGYKSKAYYNFTTNSPAVLPTTGDAIYRDGYGLHNYGSGARSGVATISVADGDILIFEEYNTNGGALGASINRGTKNATISSSTGYATYDITTAASDVTFSLPRYAGIRAVFVMEVDNDVETADYAINYKCGGVTVKTVSGTDIAVGTVISVLSSFIEGGKKYITDGGQASSLTVTAGGSNLDINVTEASQYTCTVNVKAGDVLLASEEESVYDGEDVTVYYQKAYAKDGKWYFINVNGSTPGYGVAFNAVDGNKEENVTTFALSDGVVYFAEAENLTISGTWAANGNYLNWRSNGMSKRLSANSYIYTSTINPGVYDVSLWARNNRSAGDGTESIALYLRDDEGNMTDLAVSFPGWNRGGYEDTKTATITIPNDGKNYSIAINNNTAYNSNLELDYMYVADKTVSKAISAAGWATYCSPYALDFTATIAGLDAAYLVTGGADDKLTLSPITTTIPANTGVLLKGSAGTVNIPVVASSSTDVSSNKLQGVTANTDKDANTIYVLMNDAKNGIGFYKNENAFTVGANTAYLPSNFTTSPEARAFYSLGGDVTGIQELKNSRMEGSQSYYDLQGRRVANPTKGLYIVNGKKVIK